MISLVQLVGSASFAYLKYFLLTHMRFPMKFISCLKKHHDFHNYVKLCFRFSTLASCLLYVFLTSLIIVYSTRLFISRMLVYTVKVKIQEYNIPFYVWSCGRIVVQHITFKCLELVLDKRLWFADPESASNLKSYHGLSTATS